ncbi:hypothetical protein [Bosea psychrotolerans]|uniref:Uncharacterized protein n=1 Tax=Bosea psychrotolerans TaxID=1871628 RepID=A0A2S4MH20_9HYPH|nr:hypothetical protein [Bosea psychrotolerans]POR53919.1 hypothetical protein CYD53_10316 [Bosea psychrotolerans]
MRPFLFASLITAAFAGACGHVPLTSLPKLSRIDIRSTRLADLRAGLSLPADIRPLPGGVTMTIVVEPREGGRHERKVVLEEVRDATELAALPVMVSPGRRLTVFRLSANDAARLSAFREEQLLGSGQNGNRGSLSLGADKACRLGDLSGKPIPMTSYLKTSETQDYVVVTRDLDLREAVRAIDPKIDLADAIPPCDTAGGQRLSGSPGAS